MNGKSKELLLDDHQEVASNGMIDTNQPPPPILQQQQENNIIILPHVPNTFIPHNLEHNSLNVINSTSPNTINNAPWSTITEEPNLLQHHIPNGTLTFQPNFQANASYNNSSSQLQQQQRRAITASHNFPHNMTAARHLPQQSMYLPGGNKGYNAWSTSPQQASTAPPQQPAPPTSGWNPQQNNGAAMNPWNRGRSVPNLNPMTASMAATNRKPSPTFNHQQHSSMVISPIKFRRSTSYPGKQMFPPPNPGYEVAGMEENRDPYYQVIISYISFYLHDLFGDLEQ
jgi:cytoplasmic polyadenylation element-binding protein